MFSNFHWYMKVRLSSLPEKFVLRMSKAGRDNIHVLLKLSNVVKTPFKPFSDWDPVLGTHENSLDPVQIAASDQGLYCMPTEMFILQ